MWASGKRWRSARIAGVVKTTSPIWRRRTSRICESMLSRLDGGFVDQHHRDVVLDRVDALAGGALERRAVLDERAPASCSWDRREFRAIPGRRPCPEYMTPSRFCGTIQCMKIVAIVAVLGVSSSFAEAGQARRAPQRPAGRPRQRPRLSRTIESDRPTHSFCSRTASKTTTTWTARSPRTSARWSSIRPRPTFPRSSPVCTCDEEPDVRKRWRRPNRR